MITLTPISKQNFDKIKLPKYDNCKSIEMPYYTIEYDMKNGIVDYGYYILTKENVSNIQEKRFGEFINSNLIDGNKNEWYDKMGYDRGHICPAEDFRFDSQAEKDCFYMFNIVPQKPEFNRGIWKHLEMQINKWAIQYNELLVVTGVIEHNDDWFLDESKLVVPKTQYKIIFFLETNQMACFMLNNESTTLPLSNFRISYADLNNKYLNIKFDDFGFVELV